jgi:hypothetical protein
MFTVPWDPRYREHLNVLAAKGLCSITIEGRKIVISITQSGARMAGLLKARSEFTQYERRAKVLKRHFDMTATHLMKFIYEVFPEVVSLKSNEAIDL